MNGTPVLTLIVVGLTTVVALALLAYTAVKAVKR